MSTTTTGGGLIDQAHAAHAARQQAAEAHRRELYREYVALIRRAVEPQPDHGERLAALMAALELTPANVAADQEAVRAAVELEARHADLPAARQRVRELREAERAMEARHKEEVANMWAQRQMSFGRERSDYDAAHELGALARRRPELFNDNDPPMLLGREPATSAT